MRRKSIIHIIALSGLAVLAAGCSKEQPEADAEGGIVRVVNGRMASPDGMTAEVTRTTLMYNRDTVVKNYPVLWETGDKIYSYAQSGIYMDYTLVPTDIEEFNHNTKLEIIYRIGDVWVTAYCKGPAVGDYIGYRTKDRLVLQHGIPREQNGRFRDYHICLAQHNPNEDFIFKNMQAYARFEITGNSSPGVTPGQLLGYWINYITVESINGEKMAGNQVIENLGEWRCAVEDSGDDEDKVLKITPAGEDHFTPNKDYFVAIPARRYSKGIRLNLWTEVTSGSFSRVGFVETPSVTVNGSHIINCFDLLKYVVVTMLDMKVMYAGEDVTGSTITIVKGHTAQLTTIPEPLQTTDPSVLWEPVPASTTGISITQNGEVTGVTVGTGYKVKVTSKDTGLVIKEVTVNVVPEMPASSSPASGGYDHTSFGW